ncbi:hypothetical protein GQ602_005916 [Ophiocordyceps camponoti-floridani]|uniref:Uncharacterized protein n=1 Tax=Ophiocordyceps camponoti-floridani TaxID=2030778 RepID=A0A8H4Q2A7_9HYPO|nr:hypothetical protein GQ602_005916 [Ophiocordyceps camponoti-floridani]
MRRCSLALAILSLLATATVHAAPVPKSDTEMGNLFDVVGVQILDYLYTGITTLDDPHNTNHGLPSDKEHSRMQGEAIRKEKEEEAKWKAEHEWRRFNDWWNSQPGEVNLTAQELAKVKEEQNRLFKKFSDSLHWGPEESEEEKAKKEEEKKKEEEEKMRKEEMEKKVKEEVEKKFGEEEKKMKEEEMKLKEEKKKLREEERRMKEEGEKKMKEKRKEEEGGKEKENGGVNSQKGVLPSEAQEKKGKGGQRRGMNL